ncbi:hypothetical protein RBB77_03275 [Tunturibacter psychrotolerans]|uniref:Uncharacterized protein n=1 Tax=Tunturiibacter psychrotolerans TaxID=3069686 RepID=A0AAU7ZSL5_9BACT
MDDQSLIKSRELIVINALSGVTPRWVRPDDETTFCGGLHAVYLLVHGSHAVDEEGGVDAVDASRTDLLEGVSVEA